MNNHKNARLTVYGRLLLVRRILEDGLRPAEAAQAMGVSSRTAYKWLQRYQAEGAAGLQNRSSRPQHCPHAIPKYFIRRVIKLRRQRLTYRQIALSLGLSQSTVARILVTAGLNRLSHLEPARPDNRYEHEAPGDLLHLDIKKLGRFRRPGHRVTGSRKDTPKKRGLGWEFVHIAIDDHSRIAFASVPPEETGRGAFRRVLTDNGGAYKSKAFKRLCGRLGLVHKFTRPYSPRTNGKAERFIQTALREWAYARAYKTSEQRAQHLMPWLHQYNWHRPHASLNYQPPISRSGLSVNNLLSTHN